MKSLNQQTPYIILGFVVVLFASLGLYYANDSVRLPLNQAESFNEAWTLNGDTITLPKRDTAEGTNVSTISRVLPSEFAQSQVLLIRTSLQTVEVRLDGDLLYEQQFEDATIYASMWHLVAIPHNSQGKTLSITYETPFTGMQGVLNPLYYGNEVALYSTLFVQYGFRLLVGLVTLLIGIFMMVIGSFYFKSYNRGNVQIGLFSIFLALWILAESRMLQFFTGSTFLLGSLAYIMLALMPIPIITYFKTFVLKRKYLPLSLLRVLFYSLALTIIALQLSGALAFFESVVITQALIFITIVVITGFLLYEYKLTHDKTLLRPLGMIVLISLFLLLEAVTFFRGQFSVTSVFAVTIVSAFMMIIIVSFIKFMRSRFKLSYEREVYEKLAYFDPLTQAHSRLAFEEDIDRFFHTDSKDETLSLVMFDLDDLKTINDTYGHLVGDEAIKEAHAIIKRTFEDFGKTYRIGGDEFALLVPKCDHAVILEQFNRFNQAIESVATLKTYPFNVSFGKTMRQVTDEKPSDMIKRADDRMYQEKKTKKEEKN